MATKLKANQLEIEEILNDPAAAATELKLGTVEIASQAEVDAGTDTARVVTPGTLSNAYEPLDATILRDADIGVTVQAFNANILVTADIGVTVAAQTHNHTGVYEPADVTILRDADIGVTVAAFSHVHALNDLSDAVISGSPITNQVLIYNGTNWVNGTSPEGITDHTLLSNIGTNTHAQIDAHIDSGSPIHFTQAAISITESQISDLQSYLLNITAESIGDLSDVVTTGSPTTNQVLIWNGVNWVNGTSPEGITDHTLLSNIGTNTHAQIDTHIADSTIHFTTLDGLSDVITGSPVANEVLTFNGSNWVSAPIPAGSPAAFTNNWLIANNDVDFATAPIATGANSIALGNTATTGSTIDSVAIGNTSVTGNEGIAIGSNASAGGVGIGIGENASASGGNVAVGRNAVSAGNRGTSVGQSTSTPLGADTAVGFSLTTSQYGQTIIGARIASTDTSTDVSYSVKIGAAGTFGADKNLLHLFSKGKLELYGNEAQFVFPTYAEGGSPTTVPANSVAGGTIYDSVNKVLRVYDGTTWGDVAPATGASTLDELTDVTVGSPGGSPLLTGQVLTYNGSLWTNETPAEGVTDHTLLTNIGTNTHAQIDTHISTKTPHNNWLYASNGNNFTTAPTTTGTFGIAIGNNAKAYGFNQSIVIGTNAKVTQGFATAIGYGTSAGLASCALGEGSTAGGSRSCAVGNKADAAGYKSFCNGYNSTATGANSVVIGSSATAANLDDIVLGKSAVTGATGGYSVVIGTNASTSTNVDTAVVLGSSNTAALDKQVVIGNNLAAADVTSDVAYSVKIGTGSIDATKNILHLFDAGKLELYGDKAQYIVPKYATSSEPAAPVEGSLIYDSTLDVLKTHDGATWNEVGGAAALTDLTDVTIGGSPAGSPITNQVLTYDGTNWINATPAAGVTDHLLLTNIGTNTHAQIDTHIAAITPHNNWAYANNGADFGTTPIATGAGSIAMGTAASTLSAADAVAIGTNAAIATGGVRSVAIGYNSDATLGSATAVGANSDALGVGSAALGFSSVASGSYSIAIGNATVNTGSTDSIAIGTGAVVPTTIVSAVAMGDSASASGTSSIAIGTGPLAAAHAVAIGTSASVISNYGVAIGRNTSSSSSSISIGDGATSAYISAVAIGHNTVNSANSQVSIGDTVTAAAVTTDVAHSAKLGSNDAGNKNLLHLFSKGKLELYGDEAQFIIPNYVLTGSPIAFPVNANEGALIYDSTVKGLQVYGGSPAGWSAVGGGLFTEDADNNIIGGTGAGANLTAASGLDNFLAGVNAGNDLTTGDGNIYIGNDAGALATTGTFNVGIGQNSLSGTSFVAFTGSSNTAVGWGTLGKLQGAVAGNTAIGLQAGAQLASGGNNTLLGFGTGAQLVNQGNTICIGHSAGPTTNVGDKLFINVGQSDTPLIGGDFTANTVTINGSLTVTGADTTLTFPNYAVGSPATYPANPVEGGVIYDSVAKGLQVYGGSPAGWSSTGIKNVVEDTSPELGADLSVNGFRIESASQSSYITLDDTLTRVTVPGQLFMQSTGNVTLQSYGTGSVMVRAISTGVNGADATIKAGSGSGNAGTMNVQAGNSGGATDGGTVQISAGYSTTGVGGDVRLFVGSGTSQGAVEIIPIPVTGTAVDLRFYEDATNGTNSVTLKAPSAITTSRTWVLPDTAPVNGHVLQTDGTGNLSFVAIASASESAEGLIELATQTEVDTGTDAVRAITPATLQKKAEETAMLMSIVFGI